MNSVMTFAEQIGLDRLVPARPHAIAEVAGLPLGIASYLLRNGWLETHTEDDGKEYAYRDDAIDMSIKYRSLLEVPREFEQLGSNNGIPILPAWRDERECLRVWCRWCRSFHVHGTGEGGRVAHCEWDSPYHTEGGYILEEVGAWGTEVRNAGPEVQFPKITMCGSLVNE